MNDHLANAQRHIEQIKAWAQDDRNIGLDWNEVARRAEHALSELAAAQEDLARIFIIDKDGRLVPVP